jgi:hypothetical protein
VRLPRPTSSSAAVHFAWLFGAACFLFAGVVWGGSQAHAVELTPAAAAEAEAAQADHDRMLLLGKLAVAGIAARRAGPPLPHTVERRAAAAAPSPGAQAVALARYAAALGADGLEEAVAGSSAELAQHVLSDPRVVIYPGGRYDIEAGRIDPRVLAVISYLAEAHGEVTVSCLMSGHSYYVHQSAAQRTRHAPRVVSAHTYGRAADISAIGGIPVIGNQQPGGIVDQAIQEILSLPPALQPKQVISLLDLSGPSFRLPDHYDHLHIGY